MGTTKPGGREAVSQLAATFTIIFPLLTIVQVVFFFLANQGGASTRDVTTWAVAIGATAALTIGAVVTFYFTAGGTAKVERR